MSEKQFIYTGPVCGVTLTIDGKQEDRILSPGVISLPDAMYAEILTAHGRLIPAPVQPQSGQADSAVTAKDVAKTDAQKKDKP